MHWAAIVFGWPGALSSIALSIIGLLLRRPVLVVMGAVVGLPFMLYLFATPRFWAFAAIAAQCHLGAGVALWKGRALVAWLLFIPTPLLTSYVAAVVIGLP
jgi:hypothetical protein